MPLARTHSIALVGVQGHPVEIEADIENGLVALLLVGLPDTALREARDRIRAAIVNSKEAWPQRRITVGLSPASLPKRGSSFDVGIAVAILGAAEVVPAASLADLLFIGELGLDGRLRPVRGVLPAVVAAVAAGFRTVVVPADNAPEAALVPGIRVLGAASLGSLLGWLRGGCPAEGAAGVVVWPGGSLLSQPPFCAPHHTATKAAIVGGGSGVIRPGAASLAHHGCLFLDEAPEFARDVLDALRQPLD